MAQPIQFFVDDTSPSISYSPFGDTLSIANLTAGWNPFFDVSGFVNALGEVGNGTSYHRTSLNGASLSILWKGTGIRLLGYTTQASYDITLDGMPQTIVGVDQQDQILATYQNLTDVEHILSLSARISADQEPPESSGLFFDKAVIISAAETPVNSSFTQYTQQSLDNSAVSFVGQWSFQNESTNSFHFSVTKGDVARTTFTGASFLLNGKTSPNAGAYSVILDNIKTSSSGKSSFTNSDSLLFFASGLDPEKSHNIEIINEEDGGELAVRSDGFEVFAAGPQTTLAPPTPSSVSASSKGHPKGTIAALVLAGILAFLLFTGFLFFFFVIRPRRRRAMLNRIARRRRKELEAGSVIDIGPRSDLDFDSTEATHGHGANRHSGRSGFARWKQDVEGGLGSLGIGISFRHSDSTGGKAPGSDDGENEPLSTKSSLFSTSSRPSSKRSKKGKKKAKSKHFSDRSWSPSFAIELPVRPSSSNANYKEKDTGPSHFADDHRLYLMSGLTPLSYVSAPPRASGNLAPPSYSVSSSNRDSKSSSPPQSVPRSVSQSDPSQKHSRRESSGILLNYGDPNPRLPHEESNRSSEPLVSSLAPPLGSHAAMEDRGSAKYSSDDTTSHLGSATTRLAIRGLSPRTSEFNRQNLPPDKSERERPARKPKPPPLVTPLPLDRSNIRLDQPIEVRSSAPGNLQSPGNSFLDVRSPVEELTHAARPLDQKSGSATPQVPDSAFLDIRPTSPFEVDFAAGPSQPQLEEKVVGEKPEKGKEKTSGEGNDGKQVELTEKREQSVMMEERSPLKERSPRKLRSVFRLTPPSNPSSVRHGHARKQSSSFLDFSSSSDTSNRTHSVATSEHSGRWPPSVRQQNQSRWSNTLTQMTELSRSNSSGGPIPVASTISPPHSVFSNSFPYPVSLPPSPHHPEGHTHSPTPPILPHNTPEQTGYTSGEGRHPLLPVGSPTDSIPVSVSEILFRHHSISTGESDANSHLPPHPPLPSRETPSDVGTPGLSPPSYIVQHVLGHTSSSGLDSGRSSTQPRNDRHEL